MLPPRLRAVLLVACALAALPLAVLSVARVQAARDDLAERSWLVQHAPVQRYVVLELGLQRADGSATSVWVDAPGHAEAFIDLHGSSERVDRPGQSLSARVDSREEYGTSGGFAADNTSRSAVGAYLRAMWPALVALLLIGAVWAAGRRRAPSGRSGR